jgi:hypothetical protein
MKIKEKCRTAAREVPVPDWDAEVPVPDWDAAYAGRLIMK